MDGSYNQPYGHGRGASQIQSPQTPSSATYQTNVNRSKTRKWVEARTQNYDGDDWGTDDLEQEPDSPPYQQPSVPSSSRLASYGQRTPSGAVAPASTNPPALQIPSDHSMPPAEVAHLRGDATGSLQGQVPPTMADTTQANPSGNPAGPPSFSVMHSPEVPSQPMYSSDHPDTATTTQQLPASAFVPTPPAAAAQSSDIGSMDHFGQMGRKNTTRKPVGGVKPAADSPAVPNRTSVAEDLNAHESSLNPPVRMGADPQNVPGAETDMDHRLGTSASQPAEHIEQEQVLSGAEDIERHRLSTSPQLPDMARMSAFGVDLFSGNNKRISTLPQTPPQEDEAAEAAAAAAAAAEDGLMQQKRQNAEPDQATSVQPDTSEANPTPGAAIDREPATAPLQSPEARSVPVARADQISGEPASADVPSHMWRPSVPGEQATTESSIVADQSREQDVSPVSEHDPEANSALKSEAPEATDRPSEATLQPVNDEPTIAPLRTSSPRASRISTTPAVGAGSEDHAEKEPSEAKDSAVAVNQLTKAQDVEHSPSDYDAKSLQRGATFSTVASSPLKESDILRDEIIKSLSPRNDKAPAEFPPPPEQPAQEPAKGAPRESTYTLSGYDSYWAEKDRGSQPTVPEEKTDAPGIESTPIIAEATPAIVTSAGPPISSPMGDPPQPNSAVDADDRRRFSWEAEGDEPAPAPVANLQNDERATSPPTQAQHVAPAVTAEAKPQIDGPSSGANITVEAPKIEQPEEAGGPSTDISHQVSQASTTRQAGRLQGATPEPPSPVSESEIKNQAQTSLDQRPSLAEQKSLVRSETTPVAPSPPSGTHPALVSPSASQKAASQQPLMTFREIMGLSSPQERISKYDEARTRFATIESGLSDWIANLKASQPDHANATAYFAGSLPSQASDPSGAQSTGGQGPSQQPYYQQYLNASSPTTANAPGRSRLGGLQTSGQSSGSAFGHSSDKIGTKSKEFMQSAGKMGKGLFSKGRSKLRGTGDKQSDASPPATPVQGKTKSDRRSSWALSLGSRSRTEGMGPHSSVDKLNHPPTGHSPHPSATAGRSSLAINRSEFQQDNARGSHPPGSRSGVPDSDIRYNTGDAVQPVLQQSRPQGHSRDVSIPLTLGNEDESSWDPFTGTPYAKRKSGTPVDAAVTASNEPDSRVSGDWVVVPRENAAPRGPQPPTNAAQDSGVGMSSQPDDRPIGLKRDPSFGLPMIRRSTTLDFGLKDKLESGDQANSTVDGRSDNPHADRAVASASAPALGQQAPQADASNQDAPVGDEPTPGPHPSDQSNLRAQERSQAQANLPLLQTQNPRQKAVQPPGPWKLEESYLSEPLHQVSRKRSETNDSQQVHYGLDKEMGITSTSPISTPTMGPRQRSGNQLPPSSAQRYPELFTNAQPPQSPRGRSNSGSNLASAGFPRTQSNEFDIPGVGPPEERGRRKSSGIFKEFGNRLGRSASRDRRPSVSDNRPTTSDIVRPDGASETSVWTENNPDRKKKRSSLLSGLRSRPSMDLPSHAKDMRPENGPTVIGQQGLGASASQNALPMPSDEERKSKSVFGNAGDKLKLRSSRTEKWESNGLEDSDAPIAPEQSQNKSRFSGLGGKVAGLAGAFRRPNPDYEHAPGASDSTAMRAHNEEARQAYHQPDTMNMAPLPPPSGPKEGRGRRGSASADFSGILGRSSSRTREPQQQQAFEDVQRPLGDNGSQPHLGRASMDQRPSIPGVPAQQAPPQRFGRSDDPVAREASTETRPAPPSATVRPVGQSPSPDLQRKDGTISTDAGRFDTVSPELSVRSGNQRDAAQAPVGAFQEQKPFLPQPKYDGRSQTHSPYTGMSPPAGPYQQSGYEPRQPPPGRQHPMHQSMQMQSPQGQPGFAPPNPQSSGFLHQPSSQDMLNIPGSRHSSISLSQSSTQGRQDGQQGSRWRGLKNRIAGQLGPQDQEQGGERERRTSASKLFGAFKRSSKQHAGPPVAMHQQGGHSQQWSQQGMPQPGPQGQPHNMMAQGQQGMQQGMGQPNQQFMRSQSQQYSPEPHGHSFAQGSGQQPAQRQSQQQHPGMGPSAWDSSQYGRQSSTGGPAAQQQQQPFPQSQSPPAINQPSSGPRPQGPMHGPSQPQIQPQRQYEQVPIPSAYGGVGVQGNALNMDRQMRNYTDSFQYNSPGQSPPPHQGQQGHHVQSQLVQDNGSSPPPSMPSGAAVVPRSSPQGVDNRRFSGAQGTPPPQGPNNLPAPARSSPDKASHGHPASHSPPPDSVLPPPPSLAARPDFPRGDSEVLPAARSSSIKRKSTLPNGKAEQQPRTPVTATQSSNLESNRNANNLSVDVAKAEADKEDDIYDATPRVVQQGRMGQKSPQKSPVPVRAEPSPALIKNSVKAPTKTNSGAPATGGGAFAMELEDTEEARKRTIRLDSQEEKIYYDPADDDDNPTMSATSYPGQEWNPYGDFDYSDLGDEPQNETVRGR